MDSLLHCIFVRVRESRLCHVIQDKGAFYDILKSLQGDLIEGVASGQLSLFTTSRKTHRGKIQSWREMSRP